MRTRMLLQNQRCVWQMMTPPKQRRGRLILDERAAAERQLKAHVGGCAEEAVIGVARPPHSH